MANVAIDVQLNVEGSERDLIDVGFDWLDGVSRQLAGQERQALEGLPARVASNKSDSFGPLGSPGSLFGIVSVANDGMKVAERNCSVSGMQWLKKQMATQRLTMASLWIGHLDHRGHRSGGVVGLSVRWLHDSPGWLRLSGLENEDRLIEPDSGSTWQRAWLGTMWTYADRLNPGYGQIAYSYNDGATALEYHRPLEYPSRHKDPEYTTGESRQWLRGYSWLTVVPAELVPRLGGLDRLNATGVFAQVRQLSAGGVWLLATEDFRDYRGPVVEKVFHALAPVLRPGAPRHLPRRFDDEPPPLVVLRDAADIAAPPS